jgi:tRNA(Ile2) C34 agmatinyltransferase TiaS
MYIEAYKIAIAKPSNAGNRKALVCDRCGAPMESARRCAYCGTLYYFDDPLRKVGSPVFYSPGGYPAPNSGNTEHYAWYNWRT